MTGYAIALAIALAAAGGGAVAYWACQAVPCRWCGHTPEEDPR